MRIAATRELPGPAWNELPGVTIGAEADAEILIVTNESIDLGAHPHLRLIANFGVGYDAIDVDACRARGIAVTNTPGILDAATADLAFGLMLAARRGIVRGDAHIRAGRWGGHWSVPPFYGRDLTGSTLAVVGVGRIGSAVVRRAEGFDMRVIQITSSSGDLDAALRQADVISLHVPLTERTHGLISRERLASLGDGATLVNTARGPVVDEDALVDELTSGRLTAGLDVFVHEPHVPERLRDLPNVVLTPHIASATVETRAAMTRIVVDNVLAFLRGEPLPTPVA